MVRLMMPSCLRWREALKRLRWTGMRAWQGVHWTDLLALAALGLAFGLAWLVNLPLADEVQQLQRAAMQASAPRTTVAGAPESSALDAAQFEAAFLTFLPRLDDREVQLQMLQTLSKDSGVDLLRIEYSHAALAQLSGQRMGLQLSMLASYPAYRQFLGALLLRMPNLAVDRVTLDAAPGQPELLNVRLDVSAYFRNADTRQGR